MSSLTASQLHARAGGPHSQRSGFYGAHRLLVLSACSIPILWFGCHGPAIEIKIPRASIERELRAKFPVTEGLGKIADITLRNPQLILGKHRKRLTVVLDAAVTPRSLHAIEITRGSIELSSTLAFQRKDPRILLKSVSIDSIGFNPVYRKKLSNDIAAAMRTLAEEELEGMPVYILEPGTPRRMIAGMFLRELTIQKDGIVVKLGL